MSTYTRLRDGSWGVRVESAQRGWPQVGTVLPVQKKDGTVREETIAGVLWEGVDRSGRMIALCRIRPTAATRHNGSTSARGDMVRCRHCGKLTMEGDDWCMQCRGVDYE